MTSSMWSKLLILTTLSCAIIVEGEWSGFLQKCDTPVLETGVGNAGIMTSQCPNALGHYIVTSIDLNGCLNNKGGQLFVSALYFIFRQVYC